MAASPSGRTAVSAASEVCGELPAQLVAHASGHGGHAHHAGHENVHHSGGHGNDASHAEAHPGVGHGHHAGDDAAAEQPQHEAHGEGHAKHRHGDGDGHQRHAHDGHEQHAAAGGIEWEDDMVDVNRITTPANMRWNLIDRETGAVNHEIDWQFRVGDKVKLRLVNEMDSDHPMHHPFHIHGAGRFVVLARDGAPEENLVWKDTVLVKTGETVDILLDVTNPGRWMAHCHIAEHHESGMMFSFDVAPAGTD
jgi:FtsP/CotA-like multicopper oxidase with cupredoxin domain